jgi:hypothetical protein
MRALRGPIYFCLACCLLVSMSVAASAQICNPLIRFGNTACLPGALCLRAFGGCGVFDSVCADLPDDGRPHALIACDPGLCRGVGRCQRRNPCNDDNGCRFRDKCINGFCQTPCLRHSQCLPAEFCSPSVFRCVPGPRPAASAPSPPPPPPLPPPPPIPKAAPPPPPPAGDQACRVQSDCIGGRCVAGRCKPRLECGRGRSCGQGSVCVQGRCKPV